MSDLIAILIVLLIFAVPIAVATIIVFAIVKSLSKPRNSNITNKYTTPTNVNYQQIQCRPQQNYQNVKSVVPQNTYNYRTQTNYVPPLSNYQTRSNNQNYSNNQHFPYQAVNLLTEREYKFFKVLRVIAERNNLNVLMKIRLADLIKVKDNIPKSEFYKYFNKISAKHIDFALTDGIKVVVLIELDDSTHNIKSRTERDNFVNETVTECGYKIIRTYGDTKQIEDVIIKYKQSNLNTIA